jgi:hypothetical protein
VAVKQSAYRTGKGDAPWQHGGPRRFLVVTAKRRQRSESPASRPKRPDESWLIHFFQRHPDDDHAEAVPALEFLTACPPNVRADIQAVLAAVAEAPPPSFSGGGKWEAMHGEMAGIYEVRVMGPGRHLYRLFCLLARDAQNLGGASIVALGGLSKRPGTKLRDADYAVIRRFRDEFGRRGLVLG